MPSETRTERAMRMAVRFQSRELAFGYAAHCTKSAAVLLGDDERYWIVTMADAQRLERAGYEWA